ncbi:NADPH-dependent FMN reductase [Nocardia sp. SYP-A9097]|uniref:flavodoxin family protein n=1 Tax=Nocardia sp. SYP-A9097 TaxID=2663237 RepID=UPI00129B801B|nr:flavodoxin family protein [Nocardia sp. SYP-A9097]MRH86417.1 NADPH-dependent FMN reductase [Nocardia sp. SYP-A9097]
MNGIENGSRPSIVIAYHSGWGHTEVLAEAVAEGARLANARTTVVAVDRITQDDWDALDSSDGIVFGSPTYLGDVSAAFKTFAEATSRRCVEGSWQDKVAAGFTNSGAMSGDKLHALMSMTILAAQHHMHWVNLGLVAGWNSGTASPEDMNRLGFWLGAGAQTDTDLPPDAVSRADIRTCAHLGERVARVAAQLRLGQAAPL